MVPRPHKDPQVRCKAPQKATDPTPAEAPKRITARFYQPKSGQALTATHVKEIKKQEDDQC